MKLTRSQAIARNKRREKILHDLFTIIDNKPPQEPFEFCLAGCVYKLNGGNFNAVEFYRKIERLDPNYF